ncbi:MAG: MBL fold metallo-hydrolase [Lachnospiraceae bacterium]|nr:MBL fold metallo-hydrolase [Lachnospiraceae bacterium]MBQ5375345.1 MBL fold metallo-hydrolase [Lachnospiraceae bacterium]MBR1849442.1 MBL fold metallo-hydrolase [Lachnospiraceae bacterium]
MRLCSIASGSSGNCIYVGNDHTHLLVDVGISGKRVREGVESLDLSMADLDGILITHEHSDHIQGLGVLARKYSIPIYSTKGTVEAICKDSKIGKVDHDLFQIIRPDERFRIKDLDVTPFRIAHDAADPVAYRFRSEKKSVAVCTDLGHYDAYTIENLKDLDVVLLESNHDVRMLETGPYPYPLKKRILGDRGHLSNETAGRLLCDILHDHVKAVVLGHLSKMNNLPELAYEAVRMQVDMSDCKYTSHDFPLIVAKRDVPSEAIEI